MRKQTKAILYTILALALSVCTVIGIFRINVEKAHKEVQIAIHYANVLDMARQTNRSVEEVLAEYRELGASVLFVRENTVIPAGQGDLLNFKEQGKATVIGGYELQYYYPEATNIKGQYQYIKTFDTLTKDLIFTNLTTKGVGLNEVVIGDEIFLEVTGSVTALATVGVGFNYADLQAAGDLGYTVSPQVKSWDMPTDESIMNLITQLRSIPGLGTIYFADATIPGYDHPEMIELVDEYGLGFVEFFSGKQKGFNTLAKLASNSGTEFDVVRLHTLTDSEVKKYTHKKLIDRYNLALSERNLRVFLFKMPSNMNIVEGEAFLQESIRLFTEAAEDNGFVISDEVNTLNLRPGSYVMSLIAGLGAIVIFILLIDKIGFTKVGYILGALGFIGYAGLLKLAPGAGLKFMGLFAAIIFPTYGVVSMIDIEPRSLKRTILGFLKLSAISFGGALTIIGVLSRTSYALGMDIFSGVKFAHLMPIVLVILIVYYQRHGLDIKYYRNILESKITYLTVAILGVGAVALLVYTSRTGNTGEISSLELAFRQLLDTVLGVRPRTKEFLIGHPIMIMLMYYGYQEKYLLFLVLGIIGQISLVNTYAHLHTPVLISLTRSIYGIGIGIVIGIILIYAIKLAGKVINQWLLKNQ